MKLQPNINHVAYSFMCLCLYVRFMYFIIPKLFKLIFTNWMTFLPSNRNEEFRRNPEPLSK